MSTQASSPSQPLNQQQAQHLQDLQTEAGRILNDSQYQDTILTALQQSQPDGNLDTNAFLQRLVSAVNGNADLATTLFNNLVADNGAVLNQIAAASNARAAARAQSVSTPGLIAPSTSAAAAALSSSRSAVGGEKNKKRYDFWISRRIARPGTVKPGTVSGVSKKDRKDAYKADLAELHELKINDFKKKLTRMNEYKHALIHWGSAFARHNVDRKGGKLSVEYDIRKPRIDSTTGKIAKTDKGKNIYDKAGTSDFTLTWEEYTEFVNHSDHVTRSVEDWLKSRRYHGEGGTAPDYEFELQNAIIAVNPTFRRWWSTEVFGTLNDELRQGLARASMGLDPSVMLDPKTKVEDPHATAVGFADPASGDDAYKAVIGSVGGSAGQTLLDYGIATVSAISLLRTAVKTAQGVIIGSDGNLAYAGQQPGLAGVFDAWKAATGGERSANLNKVLSSSLAMVQSFGILPTSRSYARQAKNSRGGKVTFKEVSVYVPESSTFNALAARLDATRFPEQNAKFLEKLTKAKKKGRSLFVPSPNTFYSNNIGSFLYLNGDLISSYIKGADAGAKQAALAQNAAAGDATSILLKAVVDARTGGHTPLDSNILRVLLRESRYIRNFYSSHWGVKEEPTSTVTQIYNLLIREHAFPEVLQKHKLGSADLLSM